MIKLTKKHKEIVNQVAQLEKESNCTLYFWYDKYVDKIRPAKINGIENGKIDITGFPVVCSHTVAMTMESRGILIPEEITEGFKLLKLNPNVL